MRNKEAIIVFTRVPIPGQTKTRLMPSYSPEECAEIHTCFLKDIIGQAIKTDKKVFLCYEEKENNKPLLDLFPFTEQTFLQKGESLGEKMANALNTVFEAGYTSCILIGTDIPELETKHLLESLEKLKENDVVFGPTADGGYYLVGMNKLIDGAFNNITYGEGEVLNSTIKALERNNYKIGIMAQLNDIDTPKDLVELYYRIEKKEGPVATKDYLVKNPKVSVIIPTYNEGETIEEFQEELKKLEGCEIIFVDGGSTDKTLDLIDPSYKILKSPKGRSNQMNMGALESGGQILFFLHCDSKLPEGIGEQLKEMARNNKWGAFGVSFDSDSKLMRICEKLSNRRMKKQKIAFGDQGIFVPRKLFFDIGMYQGIPIMEDYQLSLTLKERGEELTIGRGTILTSDRRYQGGTIKKLILMWKMYRWRKMYIKKNNPEDIAKEYADVR